ncbi:chorismate mutase family protein [Aurantimonas sp. Leaf443]|uniref:chorismate mutase family protein n=1 Tax=Aurantimonas sp. Leaf443 TaxID=1736378 RepID=UPI0006F9AB29|nr:chorismate mutase family protein [Aurantimonas sp. Leaf443]KQT83415.1 hypothetical protein ASG48_12700 [Aurantimonas sp. Leaf443]
MTTRAAPAACADMTALRASIDDLDRELLDLFAERMAFIHRAAELKRGAGIPAEVPERVAEVIDNARRLAAERGLDPDLYARFWAEIVAAAIAEEERRLRPPQAAR